VNLSTALRFPFLSVSFFLFCALYFGFFCFLPIAQIAGMFGSSVLSVAATWDLQRWLRRLMTLPGRVRFGSVRFGSVRFGSVRFGSVRFGLVRFVSSL
jgi:hypothetical protein